MNILEIIKERVSMLDVLELYGQTPVRRFGGTNYKCFAHMDTRPSAGLTKEGKFHCFSCGWTGNIFDVVQHFEQCDIKEAMKILDAKLHLGVYQELSESEKRKISRQIKEKEKERQEKLWWQEYEDVILADVVKELRRYEDLERIFRIEKGQYRGAWSNECGDVYFYVLKQLRWLEWLYSAICGTLHEECEYDYIYPADKKEILKMIREGEIEV